MLASAGGQRARHRGLTMTVLWFIVWLIANTIGAHEPLLFDPVNAWTATLILAIGLDLGGSHARGRSRAR
jgi:hypothetical protein